MIPLTAELNKINDKKLAQCIKLEQALDALFEQKKLLEEISAKLEKALQNNLLQPNVAPIDDNEKKSDRPNAATHVILRSNNDNGTLLVLIPVQIRERFNLQRGEMVYKIAITNGITLSFLPIEDAKTGKILDKKNTLYCSIPAKIGQDLHLKAGQFLRYRANDLDKTITYTVDTT